ncbi:uncharacterized protein MYCFIDRAFT_172934 [Pseudocercospora fijiensis CIRAD86]|uniref:Uncharacterized protein n=1 Tax=Pseudocercospora fijiensis (strain CIRAD86) TaxID=383855 RepID=M2Z219_PSEFD|nr:uncharacterized protein MYCFIDRAFT_172934 [Pseudocercospora fijiensis CIRAD86]EME83865.1 hypothetical protein MYCFIDRAFT_172934 [Pseudocercospora fijiensis CIRAD86]
MGIKALRSDSSVSVVLYVSLNTCCDTPSRGAPALGWKEMLRPPPGKAYLSSRRTRREREQQRPATRQTDRHRRYTLGKGLTQLYAWNVPIVSNPAEKSGSVLWPRFQCWRARAVHRGIRYECFGTRIPARRCAAQPAADARGRLVPASQRLGETEAREKIEKNAGDLGARNRTWMHSRALRKIFVAGDRDVSGRHPITHSSAMHLSRQAKHMLAYLIGCSQMLVECIVALLVGQYFSRWQDMCLAAI